MNMKRVHLRMRVLQVALDWLDRLWQLKPEFRNDRMATICCSSFTLILDAADEDSVATIGFQTEDCDDDFRSVVERGAVVVDAPSDKPWGARTAHVQGPGQLTFELEGPPN